MGQVDLLTIALVALVILLCIVWYTLTNKISALQSELHDRTEQWQEAMENENAVETETSVSMQNNANITEQEPVVQVKAGEKTTPTMPAEPVDSTKETMPFVETNEDAIPPETIAVIMAAVSAMGYSPASIRNIRPTRRKQRSVKWVMVGRIANMR